MWVLFEITLQASEGQRMVKYAQEEGEDDLVLWAKQEHVAHVYIVTLIFERWLMI